MRRGSSIPLDVEIYRQTPLWWRIWRRYRLVWRRRYMLFKALRKRRELRARRDRSNLIRPDDILCFVTLRNEADRLPYFLDHYRDLGVDHFLVVDNNSEDGSDRILLDAPDVSVWHTAHSYRDARFGMSWLTWLQMRYGAGHWCLTVDCDELLVYPYHPSRGLRALTGELDRRGQRSFRALMIELFPRGRLAEQCHTPGDHPADVLSYFDADGFTRYKHPEFHSLIEKGGVRARFFFDGVAEHAPPMHKTPLVKWRRLYAYADSTHTILPRWLNRNYGPARITGALLHTKFLPSVVAKSVDPAHRAQHFANPAKFTGYYDILSANPDFWHENATRYEDWETLRQLGLISGDEWL